MDAVGLADSAGSARVTSLMFSLLSILLTILSLRYSFCRRLKSVASVLEGIRNHGFSQSRWEALLGYWMLFVIMVLLAPFVLFTLGMGGFLLICMVSTSGFLIPLMC